ncbi:hypothetical protein [Pseudomarimonas arenosa]|uniref:Uncharacterized protein n=1 Tax=Pseudomarimonas arenosa TaxID=2774145 RepID=A0AAW3ZJU4_9GAMM|nr:hypothetical protein [Pseudomarimonas arenosa]MBD8526261.1 hypothetical protein [Pseudomarimonas arenosa]
MRTVIASLITAATLALSLSSSTVSAQAPESLLPQYVPGIDYTASLDALDQHWELQPQFGESRVIAGDAFCPRGIEPPAGLWLIGRDSQGELELIAPSATLLPTGHSGRVALRSCDDPELRDGRVQAYGVPAVVYQSLANEHGSLLIHEAFDGPRAAQN